LLTHFIVQTYHELYPTLSFAHLAQTVEQYLSAETPLWWVDQVSCDQVGQVSEQVNHQQSVACLWLGNAIDQVKGDRHAHIFLLYVVPAHRRQGIGSALVDYAETWARQRGDRQIGLQVFQANQPALMLYKKLGYETQSLSMTKNL
jgi:ribosomal protein S18 acetylase RimI-like enzyme